MQGISMQYSKKQIDEITLNNLRYLHTIVCSQKKDVFVFSCPYDCQDHQYTFSSVSTTTTKNNSNDIITMISSSSSSQQQQHSNSFKPSLRSASPKKGYGEELSGQSPKQREVVKEQNNHSNLVCLAFPAVLSPSEWTQQIEIVLTSVLPLVAWSSRCDRMIE